MGDTIYLVTGAPGSGKSEALTRFLRLGSDCLAFDIDWLSVSASRFAGRNVVSDASTNLPYSILWFDILRCVCRNHRRAILFAPLDPRQAEDIRHRAVPPIEGDQPAVIASSGKRSPLRAGRRPA